MGTGELKPSNLTKAIEDLKKSLEDDGSSPDYLVFNPWERCGIDRKSYRGRGRPRKEDYIYRNWWDDLTKNSPTNLTWDNYE